MKIGSYFVLPLHEGSLLRDGGVTFGVMPKTEWSKSISADESNRVRLGLTYFLVQGRGHNVLIDVGVGDKNTPEQEEAKGICREAGADRLLAAYELEREDIDTIILTHLHFGAAGGLTRLNDEGALEPAYPNARIVIQNGEWERAIHTNLRTKSLYNKEDYEPLLWHGNLDLVDGDAEVLPDITVHVTGGHTKAHQIAVIQSEGEGGVFWGDLIPSVYHLPLNAISALDLYPLVSMEKRAEWLDIAIKRDWVSFFGRDPDVAAAQLRGDVRSPEGVEFDALLSHHS